MVDSNDTSQLRFPRPVWWLGIAWVVVAIAATVWGVSNEETDLADRASQVLRDQKLTVEFMGRDAQISGDIDSKAALQVAVAAVGDIRGVRLAEAVAVNITAVADLGTLPTNSGESATTTTSTAVVPRPIAPGFVASFDRPIVQLSGTLPDQTTVDAIVAAAESRYGAQNVVNTLQVDPAIEAAPYLAAIPQIFELIGKFDPWTFTVKEGTAILDGFGPDRESTMRVGATFDRFAAEFPDAVRMLEISPEAVAVSLTELLARGANFTTGSAELSADATKRLDTVIEILQANPSAVLKIEGHTDDVGDQRVNLALSKERAESVLDYLVEGGVDPDRLIAVGFGESRPIASNDSAEGRASNRRIEFVVRERDGS